MIKAKKRFNFRLVGEQTLAKLYVAVVFAFIAAMVIVITGLSSDARAVTVFFRSIMGFVSTGLVVYCVLKILAAKDIVDFDDLLRVDDVAEGETASLDKDAAETESPDETTDQVTEEVEAEPETEEAGNSFEPLSSENLTRMESPQ